MDGLFISFEGGEGGGKTTQINRLASALMEQGRKVITTREPGGTPEGDRIRELLVRSTGGDWTPQAETLLLFASRLMNVERVIRPALEKGKIVICDRFTDSTYAYQGYGHGLDLEWIKQVQKITLDDFQPDLTFILDIDPEKGLERTNKREAAKIAHFDPVEDRFENMDLDFHQRLHQGYRAIAKGNPTRCHVIDAGKDVDAVTAQISAIVKKKL